MSPFNWTCPHCQRHTTISDDQHSVIKHVIAIKNSDGRRSFVSRFIVCPNPECQKQTLDATLYKSEYSSIYHSEILGDQIQCWGLVPDSRSKNYPSYIPQQIRDDYKEACLIRDLSPKASATLSRRCLQGMIRDFWSVRPGRLVDEIAAIQPQVDPLTWDAIEAVRKIGNIGAHMEKDINFIIDVDPEESSLLIELIETLLREWYINREERRIRMESLAKLAATKKQTPP